MACKNDLLHVDFLPFPGTLDTNFFFFLFLLLLFSFSLARIYSFLFVISLGKVYTDGRDYYGLRLLLCGLAAHLLSFISFFLLFIYFLFFQERRKEAAHCTDRVPVLFHAHSHAG